MYKSQHILTQKATSVSFATLISRVLGYVRDMLIANFFGATMAADAFFVAYRIPNLLRRLLGEGSLSTSFIPVYTKYITTKSEEESDDLVKSVFGVFGVLFVILTLIGIIFAPQIVSFIAMGFVEDDQKFQLTVTLTRIMFPFLIAIGLGAIALGILNSRKMFFIGGIAPCGLSISQILFILLICPFLDLPIIGLAYGVLIGGFIQLIVMIIPVLKRHKGLPVSFNFRHPGLKKIIRLMMPAVIGLGIMQINVFVDTICATLLKPGSVTHLYYGNRLMQLPLAVIGTALATVTLPLMSESAAMNQMKKLKDTFSFSLRIMSFLIIPASVGLIIFGSPIIELLFERGHFTSYDTYETVRVLRFYSIGLIFYAGVKVAAGAFHSLQDTKTPMIIASVSVVINVALNITVVSVGVIREMFSASGLALATAISAAINFILLIIVFRKRNGLIGGRIITKSLIKHIIASIALGIAIYHLGIYTGNWLIFVRVPAVIIASAVVYFVVSKILGILELNELKKTNVYPRTDIESGI